MILDDQIFFEIFFEGVWGKKREGSFQLEFSDHDDACNQQDHTRDSSQGDFPDRHAQPTELINDDCQEHLPGKNKGKGQHGTQPGHHDDNACNKKSSEHPADPYPPGRLPDRRALPVQLFAQK
jgi:hypothetical protein